MKKILILFTVLMGTAAISQAGINLNIGFNLPGPRGVVISRPAPVYAPAVTVNADAACAPEAPVCYEAPVVLAPPVCEPAAVVIAPSVWAPRVLVASRPAMVERRIDHVYVHDDRNYSRPGRDYGHNDRNEHVRSHR